MEREEISRLFSLDEVAGWSYLLEPAKGTCGSCGKEATLTRQVQTFKETFRVCEDCGIMITRELDARRDEG